MFNTPQSMYSAAYNTHYENHDLHQALLLYKRVVEEHPSSNEAGYAKTQILNIENDPKFVKSLEADLAATEAVSQKIDQEIAIQSALENRSFSFKQLLVKYIGSFIAINALDPGVTEGAKLVDVQQDYFSVESKGLIVCVPYTQVIKIITSTDGNVSIGTFKGKYPLVIRVFDFVIYKGAIGFGMSIPV